MYILVNNQFIKIKWSKQNKDWYVSKGYNFTKINDSFIVKAEDLMRKSGIEVKVVCDYCGKEFTKPFYRYIEVINGINPKISCNKCKIKKKAETTLKSRQEHLYNSAMKVCIEKDWQLITPKEDIVNNHTYVEYKLDILIDCIS